MKVNKHIMEQIDRKQRRKNEIAEMIINAGSKGVTVKEICIRFNTPSSTINRYIKELQKDGLIKANTISFPFYYIWNEQPKAEESTEEIELEEQQEGKIFDVVKPAHNVDQGDIVFVSSRSAGGAFFRYLVLVPWEKKATVVGIFDEGHPIVDLNSTRFVYIGLDPEKNTKIYADIANICQRGYKEFGEKLCRVEKERMDELKYIIARYYRIAIGSSSADASQHVKMLEVSIKKSTEEIKELKSKLEAAYTANRELAIEHNNMESDHKLEHERLLNAVQELDNTKKMLEESNTALKEALDLNQQYVDDINRMRKANPAKHDPDYIPTLEDSIGTLSIENEKLKVQTRCDADQIETLKAIIFRALH